MAKGKKIAAEESSELAAKKAELKHWQDYLKNTGVTADTLNNPYQVNIDRLEAEIAELEA